MANRQQRSNKETKKPKKDKLGAPKPVTPLQPAITTVVPDRHKKKA